LLVGGAATMTEFCYACHGDQAPGASTNVEKGIFDAGPSTASLGATSATQPYQTQSTFNKPLNGGGFSVAAKDWDWDTSQNATTYASVTSAHSMEKTNVMWGAGNGSDTSVYLTCTSCHDPHGSSNYRLLKDTVNGLAVGGYNEPTPGDYVADPYVMSAEVGANYPVDGWARGNVGAAQMAAYKPNYTGGTQIAATQDGGLHSLSTWCSACHENYNDKNNEKATDPGAVGAGGAGSSGAIKNYGTYEAAGTVGAVARHRHPLNVSLVAGDLIIQIPAQKYADTVGLDPRIPLEVNSLMASKRDGNIGCLTCHVAHGSAQTMSGYAAASLVGTPTATPTSWLPKMDGIPGVDPDKADYAGAPAGAGTSALLRANNRGVCERCHNK
jgi:predicted CXXCH cytochrome family protein